MREHRHTCWLIGNTAATEFSDLVAWLNLHCEVRSGAGLHVSPNFDPDWVIVLQSYPSEHDAQRFAALRGRYPMTSYLVVYGSWCAGELRTGQPLPGVERCLAVSAIARLLAWRHRERSLPTFTAADYAALPSRFACASISLALAAKTHEEHLALTDLLTTAGITIVDPHSAPLPPTWLVAGDDLRDGFTTSQVADFFRRRSDAAGWVLLNQPLHQECNWLQQHGVRQVFAKPCDMRDLLASLSR